MSSLPTYENVDFGRSFLRFSTDRVNHTPRLGIDAVCTVVAPSGAARTFVLTCACIAEAMYLPRDLIHDPVAEFNLIAEPREEFLLIKRHADARHDVRSPHKVGDKMPTRDGLGARVVELDAALERHAAAEPVRDYRAFREALLGNHLLNARTSYLDATRHAVVMEYPVRTSNVAHDQEAWQVDAGPVLMPAGPLGDLEPGELMVGRLELAFVVYNRADYFEAVVRRPFPLGGGATTNFYAQRESIRGTNEVFRVG